jgi:hypothetical protein
MVSRCFKMFHTGVLPDIYHIWLYFAKAFYCVTLEVGASWTPFFCGTSSKENAKGWLPSWIRHRLVETWAKKSQNVHRPLSISKIVHRSCYSTSVAHQRVTCWKETGDAEKDYWSAWIHSLPKYEARCNLKTDVL